MGAPLSDLVNATVATGLSVEVDESLRFESLVVDLAEGFINLEPARVDQAIEECLRRIVEALRLDRSTLFQRSGDDLVVTHSWAMPGDRRPGDDAAPR
jgi:hypothetical protein